MIAKINTPEFEVYTNQIVHPEEFSKLYNSEEIAISFKTQVNNVKDRAYASFISEKRNLTNIRKNYFVIFRAVKGNKKFEFISKIRKWGKFHILKDVVKELNLENHEIVSFEIIKNNLKKELLDNNEIDLINCSDANIVYRDHMITIVKKGTTPITLPRYIKITPDLIELCFLIHGDGHYNTKLFFVNKDIELIRFVMHKFEEILRVPKDAWRARLLFNNSASSDLAKERWRTSLNLKDEQFYPSVSKCILNTSEFGNLRIVIDKLIVAYVFRNVFSIVRQNIKEKNALYALNGLLSAEGSAEKTKERGLHKITINYSPKEKEMFKDILSEANIINLIKDRGDRFVIEGWINCYRFFKIFFSNNIIPFNLHIGRCNKALSGFLEHGFTKTMEKYLTILNRKEQIDTNEFDNELGHASESVLRTLRKKQYQNFIKIEGKESHRRPFLISITEEGKAFLTLTKIIKEVYDEKCRFK